MNLLNVLGSILALAAVALIGGCSTPKSAPVYSDVPDPSEHLGASLSSPQSAPPAVEPVSVQPAANVPTAPEAKPELIVTPDDMLTGTVVSVNEVGRFVVLRFPLGRIPAEGSKLFVYRQGLKVAELVVTGPQRDDHTVADIRTGDCRTGDEIRDR
ncbi:MAG: hypothetical protein MUC91_01950 [Verrucomicrobia bacterium]|jgi:hypothetical protein|nr:hypothetical protein [Verrucomicrobiota bacterium]